MRLAILPYHIAAKIAFPDRQSITFVVVGFTLLMEFPAAVKYNLLIVVIIENNALGHIEWEQNCLPPLERGLYML